MYPGVQQRRHNLNAALCTLYTAEAALAPSTATASTERVSNLQQRLPSRAPKSCYLISMFTWATGILLLDKYDGRLPWSGRQRRKTRAAPMILKIHCYGLCITTTGFRTSVFMSSMNCTFSVGAARTSALPINVTCIYTGVVQ